MAQVGETTIKIKADTRQFHRELNRVQWSLWSIRWGPWAVIAGSVLFGISIGAVAGVVLS